MLHYRLGQVPHKQVLKMRLSLEEMAVSRGVAVLLIHSILNIMQSENQPALSYRQQVSVTVLFCIQCSIFCPVALFTKSAPFYDMSPRVYRPALILLAIVGPVIGIVLVVATWIWFGKSSLEYWADTELSFMLLWIILIEVGANLLWKIERKLLTTA